MNKRVFQKYKIIFLLILNLFSTKLFSLYRYGKNWKKLPIEGGQKIIYADSCFKGILTIFKDCNENFEYFFDKEIKILTKLNNHPNIIKLIDFDKKQHSIILEYCDMDLLDFINNNPDETKEAILDIFIDIAKGIKHMHDNNLIHKDIKPENIVIKFEKTKITAKLIDFSFSEEILPYKDYAKFTNGIGTIGYICPFLCYQEFFEKDNIKIYKSADIYSFGSLMYSILNKKTLISLYVNNIKNKTKKYSPEQIDINFKSFLINKMEQNKNWEPSFKINNKLPELENIIYKCLKSNHKKRPNIEDVLIKLLELKYKFTGEKKF